LKPRRAQLLVLACGLAAGARVAPAEGPRRLTLEALHGATPLVRPLPTEPRWHPDGQRVTFLWDTGEAATLLALDARSGAASTALAAGRVKSLKDYRWSPDGKTLLVPSEGDLHLVDPAGRVRPLTRTPEQEELAGSPRRKR
jgi:hypothetical protein